MKLSRRSAFFPLLSALFAPVFPAAAEDSVDLAPVRRWITRQAKVKTLTADFRQERHLRTVRKPLVSEGKFWFTAGDGGGAFRWQAGEPPKLIAILTPDREFCLMEPEKKEAQVFSRETVERDSGAQGLNFLKAGFAASLEELREQFQITEVAPEGEFWRVELKPARGGDRVVVRRMTLFLLRDGDTLTAMRLYFRDGSWMENAFTRFQENPAIPAELFRPDLTGYAVKRK